MNSLGKNERGANIAVRISFLFAAFVLLLFFGLPKAEAYPVIIEIEAMVEDFEDNGPGDGYLEGKIDVGDIITGYYTYESTTSDSAPEGWLGKYEYSQPPYGMFLEVGGFHFETNTNDVDFTIYISNDRVSPNGDIYNIVSNNNSTLSNGVDIGWMYWQLDDFSGQAISSTDLTIYPPILGNWQDGNVLRIEGIPQQTDFVISARVTSAVPEPSSVLLLGIGTLILRKRR